mgnify:CR=1 FL=1
MPNILIVDDEKDIQDLIKSYVLREGFIPICADALWQNSD